MPHPMDQGKALCQHPGIQCPKHCPVAKASLCPSYHSFCMDFKLIFSGVTPIPLKGTGSMTGDLSSSSNFLWKITMEKWWLNRDSPGGLNLGSITLLTECQHGYVPMCYELLGIYCCRIPQKRNSSRKSVVKKGAGRKEKEDREKLWDLMILWFFSNLKNSMITLVESNPV